jgi:signal transduction histidine kinase
MIVAGDDYLLKVAVSNIMENGCKYSQNHSVDVKLKHLENSIEIIFEDHGIGIPEAEINKVFEPFYRGANTLPVPGTGIGLALVSQIIKNHNGTIRLESQLNKGTTVTISLPIVSGNV